MNFELKDFQLYNVHMNITYQFL